LRLTTRLRDRRPAKQVLGRVAAPGAPKLDFIFTVCDNAAIETCPYWPGQPVSAHWGVADPAAVQAAPEEIARAFREVFTIMDRRISLLLALPDPSLPSLSVKPELDKIGQS
jgi:arsenate reductase